jgi:hypothetical protein
VFNAGKVEPKLIAKSVTKVGHSSFDLRPSFALCRSHQLPTCRRERYEPASPVHLRHRDLDKAHLRELAYGTRDTWLRDAESPGQLSDGQCVMPVERGEQRVVACRNRRIELVQNWLDFRLQPLA